MRSHFGWGACALLLANSLLLVPLGDVIAKQAVDQLRPLVTGAQGSLTLGGEFVHNVGALQTNITNFGLFGSFPGTDSPMSEAPSAQWPAGSGIEYLFSAGLWVGARLSGNPLVSTAIYDYELQPGIEPIHTIYETFQGTRGGSRNPSPAADDDNDGLIDEDPLNGFDDDGDGAIDEDFAAVSNQMFRCTYRDDLPQSFINSPEHQPLNIYVIQESYQWESDSVDDFVGVEFTIFNIGKETLEDLFLAFFVDPDVGARGTPNLAEDDLVDLITRSACTQRGAHEVPINYTMGIAYDPDGDPEADAHPEGRLGIMLLDHTVDPAGVKAPPQVRLRTWQVFSGDAIFGQGGDPINDEQRYALMSSETSDRTPRALRDYRMLLSAGPFQMAAGDSLRFQVAFVLGSGMEGLLENAAQAKLTYDGNSFDLDADLTTGRSCNETLIYDPNQDIEWQSPCPWDSMIPAQIVPRGQRVWVNNDCAEECAANMTCNGVADIGGCARRLAAGDPEYWCTGRAGRETRVHWLYGTPPLPPNLRLWATEDKNVLFWDNFSESMPDISELIYDFEGYRIWRADDWDRPFGTSIGNGPSSDLWMLMMELDIDNGLGADTGLETLRYQPNVDANLMAFYTDALMMNPAIHTTRDFLPPIGYTIAEADTALALAKTQLGLAGGKIYYRYEDTRIHTGMHYFYSVTAMDHVRILENGLLVGYGQGLSGNPANSFVYTVPQSRSQQAWAYDRDKVYVVPNPATSTSMAPWALQPNNDDPSGLKVEFRHLPAERCTIRIYSLGGDLVETLVHDMTESIGTGDLAATGTAAWDLVSRKGQDVASGVYLFSVEAEGFPDKVGKFVVIR